MGWIGATTTHGIAETHVVHHLCSKIPHYHAYVSHSNLAAVFTHLLCRSLHRWEATRALRKRLTEAGIHLEGRPAGWVEVYRVYKECKFVEDVGDIVFYKNAYGLASTCPRQMDTFGAST